MTLEKNDDFHIIGRYENIDRTQWATFVASHPNGTIFQTPDYYEIHIGVPGFRPYVLAVYDNSGGMIGVMVIIIKKVYGGLLGTFTSRAVIAGGPLAKWNDPTIVYLLLQRYLNDKNISVVYSQFRNLFELGSIKQAFNRVGAKYEDHLNILIDLTKSEDALWKEVKSRKRNNIRKAQQNGLEVRRLYSIDEIKKSHIILKEVYKNAKLPLADESLFTNAFKQMHSRGILRVYGSFLNNELIGAMFIFSYNGRFYDWYAGSFRQYYSFNPNDILPWGIFKIAQSEGIPLFDFGGAGKPGIPYGVRDYKIQFGGELVNFGRYELPHNKFIFNSMKFLFKIWQLFH